MMVKSLLATLCFCASVTAASALDIKQLSPCKRAATKYCDTSDPSATMSNLLRCGATLAAVSQKVGARCRVVLRQYGAL